MKLIKGFIILLTAVLLTSCVPAPSGTATVAPGTSEQPGATATAPAEPGYVYDSTGKLIQQPSVRDYARMWWRDGFSKGKKQMNFQTGYYGLTVNTQTGSLNTLGTIEKEYTQDEAAECDNDVTDNLPQISSGYSVIKDGAECEYSYTEGVGNTVTSRILESGRYMQRIDIMYLKFKGITELDGRVEIAVMPRYMALEFGLYSPDENITAGLKSWITLPDDYTVAEESLNGRGITLKNASGAGVTFIAPEGVTHTVEGSTVTFLKSNCELKKRKLEAFGVVMIPSANASSADAENYIAAEALSVTAEQITPREGKTQETVYDANKGYLSIDMNKMMTATNGDFNDEELLDDLDRLKFTITNNSEKNISLPIQFVKEKALGVTGMSPLLRDAETGEPIGVQVQLSKNWHSYTTDENSYFYAAINDVKREWSGTWFHGYTMLDIPANSTVSYEMCITYAMWGGAFASSHAQLCLAGWGGNYQQWETSSIGSFGEAFCYDPETAHGRSFIDDIRPLLVNSMGGKYGWTACNGGGNMLMYNIVKGLSLVGYKQVKTQFKKQGPCLTEVIYTGLTVDDAVRFKITVNMGRTDDAARAYHTFEYTFLKDVSFDRMVFYQFGADNYNDNRWDALAIGNDEGTQSFSIDGETYSGEFANPTASLDRYIGTANNMQRIDIGGNGLWFFYTKAVPLAHKNGPDADRLLNVLSYEATLNGTLYSKPSFNIRATNNNGYPCSLIELCPAEAVGNKISAGSTVKGTVEYVNLPRSKTQYYGPSSVMNAIPADEFGTWKIGYRYAVAAKYSVSAAVGTVVKQYPIHIQCASGDVLAEVTVTGGNSYVPLTFAGVPSYKGYHLEKKNGAAWEKVDQSVYGNDYWQAWFDSSSRSYELTFNVEHNGDSSAQYSYRLVKD